MNPQRKGFTKADLARAGALIGGSNDQQTIANLRERVAQFDAAIQKIGRHVGAVCGGVDTGHTADEIIRCIDSRLA